MKKRLFILFLIVSLLLPLVPAPARAAEDTLESEIRQQLTVYISTLGKPDATGAKNKLINHALYGKGKDLHMGESDVFTVAMLTWLKPLQRPYFMHRVRRQKSSIWEAARIGMMTICHIATLCILSPW